MFEVEAINRQGKQVIFAFHPFPSSPTRIVTTNAFQLQVITPMKLQSFEWIVLSLRQ